MNALSLQAALESSGVETRVQTAIEMRVRPRPLYVYMSAYLVRPQRKWQYMLNSHELLICDCCFCNLLVFCNKIGG